MDIIQIVDNLSEDMWVSNLDQLLGIVQFGTGKVKGFIKEEQIDRFLEENPAVFIPNDGIHDKVYLVSKDNVEEFYHVVKDIKRTPMKIGQNVTINLNQLNLIPHIFFVAYY